MEGQKNLFFNLIWDFLQNLTVNRKTLTHLQNLSLEKEKVVFVVYMHLQYCLFVLEKCRSPFIELSETLNLMVL